MRFRDLLLTAAAATLVACSREEPPPSRGTETAPSGSGISVSEEPAAEEHSHDARHGGDLVELGEHEGHLEIVHDQGTGTLTAWVYDADMKEVAVDPPVVNLTKGGVQVAMVPASGAGPRSDAWRAVHDALKAEPLEGRIRVKIGERTYQAPLDHHHEPK